MDLKALRYFVEVVRQKNFTRAAELLHVTQPTLSKMIRQLEEELRSDLLVRSSRGVWTTDVGDILYRHGCQILEQVRSAVDEIAEVEGLTRGELRLGLTPMMGAARFPDVLRTFRKRYPNIALTAIEYGSKRMAQSILDGEVELGVMVEPVDQVLFDARRIYRGEVCLVVPAESPWAQHDSVAIAALAGENFLMPTDDFMLPHMVRSYCRAAGFTPKEVGHSGQWEVLQVMVETGMGLAMLPRAVCRLLDPGKVVPVRLDSPSLTIDVSLAWRRGGYPSFAARAWIEVSTELFSQGI